MFVLRLGSLFGQPFVTTDNDPKRGTKGSVKCSLTLGIPSSPHLGLPFPFQGGMGSHSGYLYKRHRRGAAAALSSDPSTSSHTYIPLFFVSFFLYYSLSQLHLYISSPELIINTTNTNPILNVNHAPSSRNSHRRRFLPTFLPRKATTPSKAPVRSILPPGRPNPPSTHSLSRRSFKLLFIRWQCRVLRR